MRLALSPLTAAAAAEVADGESTRMDQARTMVVLPDFLTWIEWRDAPCGVPGERFGVLLQAMEDQLPQTDASGLLFALPADWTPKPDSFNAMPIVGFELRLKSTALPLLQVTGISRAVAEPDKLDPGGLGRFLLATLTLIGQPRMAETVDAARDPGRQAVDRARVAKRIEPQVSLKEVRLVIDLPREAGDMPCAQEATRGRGGGVAPGGMPWHRVRMFWRWRLGRLEVVRPHYRGSMENGISRRVTLLVHPDEKPRGASG